MIPLHLTLRNFLSYREAAELDFSGIQLACITGQNGAGKSTILDGITWALFGKSRVKSDDDIVNRIAVRNGAAAEVEFIFELEGAIYRIIRRKVAGKTSELEFHARVMGDGSEQWKVRTEAKVRETQAEIEKLLRMNYDVFTNASFLLQGKADEFTTKTPDKRKEILAEILGVSLWDSYKELATERRKETESEVNAVDRRLAEVDSELSQEEDLARALELAEARVKTLAAERDRQDALVIVARKNKTMADLQNETLRRLKADLAESSRELERINATYAQRRSDLETHQALIDRHDAIEADYKAWQVADAEFAGWQEKAEQYSVVERERHPLEMMIARMETELQQRLRDLEVRQSRAEQARAELIGLRVALQDHQEQLVTLQKRAAEVAADEQAWQYAQAETTRIANDRKLWSQELAQLETRSNQIIKLERELEQATANRLVAEKAHTQALAELASLAEQRDRQAEKKAEKAGLEGEQTRLHAEANDIKALLNKMESDTEQECPLCGQPLTADHRQTVIAQLKADGADRGNQYRRNKTAISALENEISELDKTLRQQAWLEKEKAERQANLARIDARLIDIENHLVTWRGGEEIRRIAELKAWLADDTTQRALAAQIESLKSAAETARKLNLEANQISNLITRDETRIEELERVRRDWEQRDRPALEETNRLLVTRAFAATERESLTRLEERLTMIGHDPNALVAARERRAKLATAPQQHQQLLQAEAAVKPLIDSLADLTQQQDRATARSADLNEQVEKSAHLLRELETDTADLPAAEAELRRLREEVVLADRSAEGARQRVSVLAVRREDRRGLAAERTRLARSVGLLRQLEEACGRKGVQAMLIESALPEIENYANELLDRLTGGDMRVSFETQRPGKSRQDSLIDTLDIRISDSTGERPYENYSGGEKFRINFAVRLALSQVLAHRAGARLQSLVIDEGFGSQDPEGRQRLVEAINAIQDKFACILVITHIDELRDKFPARIDVEKTPAGSRLSVFTL